MGKQGPCYHCGITTTPLWRNGPPEKPVLCNACGSRWRTKGTLLNYMPMHSGGFGVGNDPDKWPRSMKNSFAKLSRKRKEPSDGTTSDSALSKAGVYFSTPSVEEETSTRSSLGSEVSTFDGPVNTSLGTARASPWDTPVPSRKRTNMFRSRASSERLSRSLISMEEQEVSSVTYPSSETILVETKSPLVAVEIGLGSVFIRQPTAQVTQERESEATSSLLIDSHKSGEVENCSRKSLVGPSRGKEKVKPSPSFMHPVKPSKAHNKRDVLQSSQSPLVFLDLKDIVNFDTFTGLLTEQEQLQLTKHLPSVDVAHCPESLKNMFSSGQFEVAMSNFQQLLSAGMFDVTELGPNQRVQQHFQQLLNVTDLTSSGWMDRCSQLQQARSTRRRSELEKYKGKNDNAGEQQQQNRLERAGLFSKPLAPPLPRQTLQRDVSKTKHVFAEPRAVVENANARTRQQQQMKSLATHRGEVKPQQRSIMEEGHDSGGELDLLVEVPPSMSFHQAEELLLINRGPASVATRDLSVQEQREEEQEEDAHEGDLIMSNTWHTSDWDGGLIWTPSTSSASKGIVLPNGTVLNP